MSEEFGHLQWHELSHRGHGNFTNQSAAASAFRTQSKINIYPEKVSNDADKCIEPMTIQ